MTPDLTAYLHLIIDLHAAMLNHGDDSPEADAIRDRADMLDLTANDAERARNFSEFLYALTEAKI